MRYLFIVRIGNYYGTYYINIFKSSNAKQSITIILFWNHKNLSKSTTGFYSPVSISGTILVTAYSMVWDWQVQVQARLMPLCCQEQPRLMPFCCKNKLGQCLFIARTSSANAFLLQEQAQPMPFCCKNKLGQCLFVARTS